MQSNTSPDTALDTSIGEAVDPQPSTENDRRRHRRFICEGTAEVVVLDPSFLFRGAIRDLSETGCLVLTKARLRVERLALVEIRFTLGGCQYRADARVMNIRVGTGVGLEFLFADAEAQEQFETLCRKLNAASPKE